MRKSGRSRNFIRFSILFTLILSLTACGSTAAAGTGTAAAEEATADSVLSAAAAEAAQPARSMQNFARKAKKAEKTADDGLIRYTYQSHPVRLENKAGDAMITGNYYTIELDEEDAANYPKLEERIDAFNEAQKAAMDEFFEGSEKEVAEFFARGMKYGYEDNIMFMPVRSDAQGFSFATSQYLYLGGAHGVTSYEAYSIDPVTGKDIPFYDVVADGTNLPGIIINELQTGEDALPSYYFEDQVDEKTGETVENEDRVRFVARIRQDMQNDAEYFCWALNPDGGITAYYGDYAVGPYAAGSHAVPISAADYPEVFTGRYAPEKDSKIPPADQLAVEAKKARVITKGSSLSPVEQVLLMYSAYLSFYDMDEPLTGGIVVDADDSDADQPEEVIFTLLYLDDDDIPELAVANGTAPWNPVHLICYDPDQDKVKQAGIFSMYGQMLYLPGSGYFIPMYFAPAASGEVCTFENGTAKVYESWYSNYETGFYVNEKEVDEAKYQEVADRWVTTPMQQVFTEESTFYYKDVFNYFETLQEAEKIAARAAKEAAGAAALARADRPGAAQSDGLSPAGIWVCEEPSQEAYYLEFQEDGSFAMYDEDRELQYMGMYRRTETARSDQAQYLLQTPDGGILDTADLKNGALSLEERGYAYERYQDTGGGLGLRTPSVFLDPDLAFLGDWKSAKRGDRSTLTVSKADVQTGGYELDFIFYRKAVGHAYANPDEKALVINQGTLNDDYRFYGKLERLDEYGLRFTVTQSELSSLPVGTVYEFERSY